VGPFRTWNAGGFKGKMAEGKADDVAFVGKLLDDLASVLTVDEDRIYACGMSNGGMMCYRLAAEILRDFVCSQSSELYDRWMQGLVN
jgi:polyhydroxybutyrate depolymerase